MAILSRKALDENGVIRLVLNTPIGKLRHLNDYELALLENGFMPKSYLLKRASLQYVDRAIARMLEAEQIEVLRERTVEGAELIRRRVPELREGRYKPNMTPEEFRKRNRGTRGEFATQILHADYKFIWELGKGRLALGLALAVRKAREVITNEEG